MNLELFFGVGRRGPKVEFGVGRRGEEMSFGEDLRGKFEVGLKRIVEESSE